RSCGPVCAPFLPRFHRRPAPADSSCRTTTSMSFSRAAARPAAARTAPARPFLANIHVLAIDQNVEEKGAQKVALGKTATLELTPGQAETLALSQQTGTLSLALRSLTSANVSDAFAFAFAPNDDHIIVVYRGM